MKINPRIFSFPPYISTSWTHVVALHMNQSILVVSLTNGVTIEIPNLKPDLLELIFSAHAAFLEVEMIKDLPRSTTSPVKSAEGEDSSVKFGLSLMDGFGGAMLQHNSAQSNAPDIPPEIIKKIKAISKIMTPEETESMPKPEPHCNCMYCQIARAVAQQGPETPQEKLQQEEPPVPEEDLKFQQWDIISEGEKMFTVVNRLDRDEKYSVYLGDPVGCTCGKPGCDHILAVLRS
jgi:hypothetical protein